MIKLQKVDKGLLLVFTILAIFVGYNLLHPVKPVDKQYVKKSEQKQDKNENKKEDQAKQQLSNKKEFIKGGKVWLSFDRKDLKKGDDFLVKIYVNTNNNKLGVFNMNFNFDPNKMQIDLSKGKEGLDKGEQASKYTMMSNADNVKKGDYRFAGIAVNGCIENGDSHLVTIYFKSLKNFTVDPNYTWLKVNEFGNDLGRSFDIKKIQEDMQVK